MIQNLEYYKVFYYVSLTGSLTKAAGLLAISQPAVSQSVKQLEYVLGISLFVRGAKGVRLTQEGQLLYQYIKEGYEIMEEGEKRLMRMLDLDLGEIRIGASDMTLRFFLLPYLERFHEKYPKIKVIVTNAPTPETLRYLKERKIDFGIVSGPFKEQAGLIAMPVLEIEDVFIAGRKFMQYKNKTMDFKELEELPLITLERSTSTRRCMDTFLEQNHVTIEPEFELATSDMIVQFVLRNLGIGCIMKQFAKENIESGQLFELRFNKRIPRRQFYVVTNEKEKPSLAAKNLLQLIFEDKAK